MGLDMYLTKKTYISRYGGEPLKIEGLDEKSKIKPERISGINEEIGYWRKSNQIHKWFVDNVQNGIDDCGEYRVSVDQLKELLKKVKEVIKTPYKADEILPAQQGFFFGSYDYDSDYFEDLQNTKKIIEDAIESVTDGVWSEIYYSSSW